MDGQGEGSDMEQSEFADVHPTRDRDSKKLPSAENLAQGEFRHQLNVRLANSRASSESLLLIAIDLDHFKLVNHMNGRVTGDEILDCVVGRLTNFTEHHHWIGRLESDQFAAIVTGPHEVLDPSSISERILAILSDAFHVREVSVFVTATIGISVFPTDSEDSETLIQCATQAIRRAMGNGHNTFECFSMRPTPGSQRRAYLESELALALERNELSLFYQPQFELKSGLITGVEALLRWHHRDLGSIARGEFISIAEQSGLIYRLDQWVLRTACEANSTWQALGLPHIVVAVNMSARQFNQTHIAEMVTNALGATRLDARYLELELTESMAIDDSGEVRKNMHALEAAGIRLAIDDFGTGYCNLSVLGSLPLATLKIDASFVRNLDSGNGNLIASLIVDLGRALKLRVVAEGVETRRQLRLLKEIGCDAVQGFLTGRPVSQSAMTDQLRRAMSEPAVVLQC